MIICDHQMQRVDALKPLKRNVLIKVSNLTVTSTLVQRRLTSWVKIVYQLKRHIWKF